MITTRNIDVPGGWSADIWIKETTIYPFHHTFVPFIMTILFGDPVVIIAGVYLWETIEAISLILTNTYFGTDSVLEPLSDSFFGDPSAGVIGAFCGLMWMRTLKYPHFLSEHSKFHANRNKRILDREISIILALFTNFRSYDSIILLQVALAAIFDGLLKIPSWDVTPKYGGVYELCAHIVWIGIAMIIFLPKYTSAWDSVHVCSFWTWSITLFIALLIWVCPIGAMLLVNPVLNGAKSWGTLYVYLSAVITVLLCSLLYLLSYHNLIFIEGWFKRYADDLDAMPPTKGIDIRFPFTNEIGENLVVAKQTQEIIN